MLAEPFSTSNFISLGDHSRSWTLDDIIVIPEDEDETGRRENVDAPSRRANAMALTFILGSTERTPDAASKSETETKSMRAADAWNGRGHQASDTTMRVVETILDALSPCVRGWAPADGSPYLTLDDVAGATAAAPVVGPASTLLRADGGVEAVVKLEDEGEGMGETMLLSPSMLLRRGEQTAREHETQDVPRPNSSVHARSPKSPPAPFRLLGSSTSTSGPPLPFYHPFHDSVRQPLLQSYAALSLPSTAKRPGPPPPPPPRPPRGGVSPGRARSITHIRMARERAQAQMQTHALREGPAAERVPSVLRRWAEVHGDARDDGF